VSIGNHIGVIAANVALYIVGLVGSRVGVLNIFSLNEGSFAALNIIALNEGSVTRTRQIDDALIDARLVERLRSPRLGAQRRHIDIGGSVHGR
jgi:hypothetical protein